jgi:hypothetical protein
MFGYATNFNYPLDNWYTNELDTADFMFKGAVSFNQNISNWHCPAVRSAFMFDNCGISEENKPKIENE